MNDCDRRENVPGTIYIIHFDQPFRHARHYVGWTEGAVEDRIAYHRSGRGAVLLRAVNEAGIGWSVVETFPGTRYDERRIKKSHHRERYCPVCCAKQKEGAG